MTKLNLAEIRRQYGITNLNEADVVADPLVQLEEWLAIAVQTEIDATAMTLATVDVTGQPDARIVLLKDLTAEGLCFFTNYHSAKAQQLASNPHAAAVFYWPTVARQVRVRGHIERLNPAQSEAYFASRPRESQISALISSQSQVIASRAQLEHAYVVAMDTYATVPPKCPENWGGYQLIPYAIEFFQGRDNRLHDRLLYMRTENTWHLQRLAP